MNNEPQNQKLYKDLNLDEKRGLLKRLLGKQLGVDNATTLEDYENQIKDVYIKNFFNYFPRHKTSKEIFDLSLDYKVKETIPMIKGRDNNIIDDEKQNVWNENFKFFADLLIKTHNKVKQLLTIDQNFMSIPDVFGIAEIYQSLNIFFLHNNSITSSRLASLSVMDIDSKIQNAFKKIIRVLVVLDAIDKIREDKTNDIVKRIPISFLMEDNKELFRIHLLYLKNESEIEKAIAKSNTFRYKMDSQHTKKTTPFVYEYIKKMLNYVVKTEIPKLIEKDDRSIFQARIKRVEKSSKIYKIIPAMSLPLYYSIINEYPIPQDSSASPFINVKKVDKNTNNSKITNNVQNQKKKGENANRTLMQQGYNVIRQKIGQKIGQQFRQKE